MRSQKPQSSYDFYGMSSNPAVPAQRNADDRAILEDPNEAPGAPKMSSSYNHQQGNGYIPSSSRTASGVPPRQHSGAQLTQGPLQSSAVPHQQPGRMQNGPSQMMSRGNQMQMAISSIPLSTQEDKYIAAVAYAHYGKCPDAEKDNLRYWLNDWEGITPALRQKCAALGQRVFGEIACFLRMRTSYRDQGIDVQAAMQRMPNPARFFNFKLLTFVKDRAENVAQQQALQYLGIGSGGGRFGQHGFAPNGQSSASTAPRRQFSESQQQSFADSAVPAPPPATQTRKRKAAAEPAQSRKRQPVNRGSESPYNGQSQPPQFPGFAADSNARARTQQAGHNAYSHGLPPNAAANIAAPLQQPAGHVGTSPEVLALQKVLAQQKAAMATEARRAELLEKNGYTWQNGKEQLNEASALAPTSPKYSFDNAPQGQSHGSQSSRSRAPSNLQASASMNMGQESAPTMPLDLQAAGQSVTDNQSAAVPTQVEQNSSYSPVELGRQSPPSSVSAGEKRKAETIDLTIDSPPRKARKMSAFRQMALPSTKSSFLARTHVFAEGNGITPISVSQIPVVHSSARVKKATSEGVAANKASKAHLAAVKKAAKNAERVAKAAEKEAAKAAKAAEKEAAKQAREAARLQPTANGRAQPLPRGANGASSSNAAVRDNAASASNATSVNSTATNSRATTVSTPTGTGVSSPATSDEEGEDLAAVLEKEMEEEAEKAELEAQIEKELMEMLEMDPDDTPITSTKATSTVDDDADRAELALQLEQALMQMDPDHTPIASTDAPTPTDDDSDDGSLFGDDPDDTDV